MKAGQGVLHYMKNIVFRRDYTESLHGLQQIMSQQQRDISGI